VAFPCVHEAPTAEGPPHPASQSAGSLIGHAIPTETAGRTCAFMTGMVEPGAMAEVTTESGTSDVARPFERFFQDEYEGLSRALYLVTGSRTEAEDIAQEAMVRVFERWDRVMSTRSPVGYLYRTALNLYRSRLRRAAVRLRRGTPETAHLDPIAEAEDRDELGRLLAHLPDGQREALVLVVWLGMTDDEAGSVLGIEPVSVRVRVSRAKATLRAAGRDDQDEEDDEQ
jgi:RNA polymerase sigma-70 factor, ECF subfamily